MSLTGKQKELYQLQADVLAAAGHPIRLAIIDYLRDGERCVCDIAGHVGANRSNVSRHLAVMLHAGLLRQRKDGLKMMYELRTPCVLKFLRCVSEVLKARLQEQAAVLSKL
jgi:ArsR family transcriptional regulator